MTRKPVGLLAGVPPIEGAIMTVTGRGEHDTETPIDALIREGDEITARLGWCPVHPGVPEDRCPCAAYIAAGL